LYCPSIYVFWLPLISSNLFKDLKISICCCSDTYAAERSKSKDLLTLSQCNVSEWNDMSTCRLVSVRQHYKYPSEHVGAVHSWLITGFVTRATWWATLVEQELLILYGVIVVSPFVLFLLAIVLPVHRFTDSDYLWYLQTLLSNETSSSSSSHQKKHVLIML
jgi:hypothetical protein